MSKPYEVHARGRRAIACETREEAEDWAQLLSTTAAPATVLTRPTTAAKSTEPVPGQQSIFDSLEGTA